MNSAADPVDLSDVRKAFGGREVLRGVTLSVPRGSVTGMLGKNGSGKTTLIKCALGLLKLDGGHARLLGEDAWNLSAEAKARIGYVPQVINLYGWMKVGQVVDYTGAFYERWDRELAKELLGKWELRETDRVGPLSVGQMQKLAIVLALGHRPDLLILDEPAASLDPGARREFLATLLELTASEHTILFSTHIVSDLERVADRIAILKDGRCVYDGELDVLKDQVKQLHIQSQAPLSPAFSIPGALHTDVQSNQALVSVKHLTPGLVEQIAAQWNATVEVRDLNLEDIFLEMHHERRV